MLIPGSSQEKEFLKHLVEKHGKKKKKDKSVPSPSCKSTTKK